MEFVRWRKLLITARTEPEFDVRRTGSRRFIIWKLREERSDELE